MFSRPPPPQGAPPPSYALVTRVYRRSLRPVVLGISLLSAIWLLVWGVASFRDISIDKQNAARLEIFDIVLGSLYMAALAIELFGLAAAGLQRLALVRIYAFVALGAAVIITATELMRVIIHFAFKTTLINECTTLATGDKVVTRFGIWGPTTTTILSQDDARDFCNNAWSHDSFSEIAWFIVVAILSFLFASISFSYYRQMLDPQSPANAARAPSARARAAGIYPEHYNRPYNGPEDFALPKYAPPAGAPPGAHSTSYVPEYEPSKLPGYGEGDANEVRGFGQDDKKDADPFADNDFDGPSRRDHV